MLGSLAVQGTILAVHQATWAPFHGKLFFSPDTGIECPRGARNLPGLVQEGEPFSEEATLFTKELVLQREVGHLPAASWQRRREKMGLPQSHVFLPCRRSVCRLPRPCSILGLPTPCSLSPASPASRAPTPPPHWCPAVRGECQAGPARILRQRAHGFAISSLVN